MATKGIMDAAAKMTAIVNASNQSAATAEKAREDTLNKFYERLNKQRETVDIRLLDPAPDDWNRYPRLSDEKMLMLKMSIMNNGIMDPLIVWEKDDGRYMILSGHNRTAACKEILEEYADSDHRFDYSAAPAIIYHKDEIDEIKAQEIIIDVNYLQRNDLPSSIRAAITSQRRKILQQQKDERGATIAEMLRSDEFTKRNNKAKSAVYDDVRIGTQLYVGFQDMFYAKLINRKAAVKLCAYPEVTQKWIYETFPDRLTNSRFLRLGKSIKTEAQIREIFEADEDDGVVKRTVQITTPANKVGEIKKICRLYISDPEFSELCKNYFAEKASREGEGG